MDLRKAGMMKRDRIFVTTKIDKEYRLPVLPNYLIPVYEDENTRYRDVGELTREQAEQVCQQWRLAFLENVEDRRQALIKEFNTSLRELGCDEYATDD
jgi:hypothetical protein